MEFWQKFKECKEFAVIFELDDPQEKVVEVFSGENPKKINMNNLKTDYREIIEFLTSGKASLCFFNSEMLKRFDSFIKYIKMEDSSRDIAVDNTPKDKKCTIM